MGTKVYTLMYGYGEDKRIGGVYSTREAAEAAKRFGDEDSKVQEHEVDAPQPEGPAGRSLWRIEYHANPPEFTGYRVPAFKPYGKTDQVTINESGDYCVTLWAVDKEEADLLAAAHFQRYNEQHALPDPGFSAALS